MSKMRIVIFGLAFGSAIMAGLLAKGFIGQKPEKEIVEINKVKTVDVLTASKDINMGERFVDGSTAWKPWPVENVTDFMITRDEKPNAREEYLSARARITIFEGETVLEKKLVLPGQSGFMSAILPKGMRAISVAVSERSGAGGFILPNDRVDVILTKKVDNAQGSDRSVNSEIVLSNVRVLAINQTYRQDKDGDSVTVAEGKTATLELDPRQSEIIAMIESVGELSLALRSIAENDGKNMEKEGPKLSDNYSGKKKAGGGDTLFVRYGVETYTSTR
jgi:pilus assembly protein CpaB